MEAAERLREAPQSIGRTGPQSHAALPAAAFQPHAHAARCCQGEADLRPPGAGAAQCSQARRHPPQPPVGLSAQWQRLRHSACVDPSPPCAAPASLSAAVSAPTVQPPASLPTFESTTRREVAGADRQQQQQHSGATRPLTGSQCQQQHGQGTGSRKSARAADDAAAAADTSSPSSSTQQQQHSYQLHSHLTAGDRLTHSSSGLVHAALSIASSLLLALLTGCWCLWHQASAHLNHLQQPSRRPPRPARLCCLASRSLAVVAVVLQPLLAFIVLVIVIVAVMPSTIVTVHTIALASSRCLSVLQHQQPAASSSSSLPLVLFLSAMELHSHVLCPQLHTLPRNVQLSRKASYRQDLAKLRLPYRIASKAELTALKQRGLLSMQAPSSMLIAWKDAMSLLKEKGEKAVRKRLRRWRQRKADSQPDRRRPRGAQRQQASSPDASSASTAKPAAATAVTDGDNCTATVGAADAAAALPAAAEDEDEYEDEEDEDEDGSSDEEEGGGGRCFPASAVSVLSSQQFRLMWQQPAFSVLSSHRTARLAVQPDGHAACVAFVPSLALVHALLPSFHSCLPALAAPGMPVLYPVSAGHWRPLPSRCLSSCGEAEDSSQMLLSLLPLPRRSRRRCRAAAAAAAADSIRQQQETASGLRLSSSTEVDDAWTVRYSELCLGNG